MTAKHLKVDIDKLYKRCLSGKSKDLITANIIYLYSISPFMVYCEKFGPEDKKDPLPLYQQLLLEQGTSHEEEVIETDYPEIEKPLFTTPLDGFRLLLEGMKKGEEALLGLPVYYLPEGLMGIFDVLERRDTEKSIWGNYHYVVKEIKLAKNIQNPHIQQAAFYNYILGKIQGFTPPVFYVINRDQEEIEEIYNEAVLLEIIKNIREILKGGKVSPTYGVCLWPWESFNNAQAIRENDVSLVSGVGPSFKRKLTENKIYTVRTLSETSVEDLTEIKGIGSKTAVKFSRNSKALISKKCIPIGSCQFPSKKTEIFLDLEGTGEQPSGDELVANDYLIGVIIRTNGKSKYVHFLAHKLGEEGEMFREFVKWLMKQEDIVIYHWHHYERVHLERLMLRYGLSARKSAKLFGHMRDLYLDAVSCFAFPTFSYGLKDIARYMGYKWKHPDVDALESIALYFKYVEEPKRNKDEIKKVLDYNEDDCRATMLVKDWLQRNLKLDDSN